MFEKAENKAKEFSGAAQEKLGELTGSAEHQARGAAKKYAAQGSGALQDAADAVKEQVESNPAGAAIVAGLAGLVLGFLLGRK
ncbi:CsbD family protein [Serratia ureilytica]|jgi:uncharacterized protein YjbJ (UPF0337 family)|uniref:CsbD family protein n=1 Tax=Serratia TaxID=613 RepID=UPI00164E12CE|nr:CsbD family protein [Serratia ureilytica]MBH3005673.1 CsbD family protein [Serratia marcescens]QNK99754.1 CsbD family protein [Serratia ureilytica]